MPSISIIIPAYNVEEYIEECLDSILNQTFTDYEVIVVDDCSTDNTYSIIQSYIPKFNNKLTLLKTDNNSGRCSIPRNIAIPYAKGNYIWFIDADDYISRNALEILYNTAKEYNADVVYTSSFYKQHNGQWYQLLDYYRKRGQTQIYTINQHDKLTLYGSKLIYTIWVKFIKRNIILEHNLLFKPFNGEDLIFSIQLLYYSSNFVVIPETLYYYRESKNSVSRRPSSQTNKILAYWANRIKSTYKYISEFFKEINYTDTDLLINILNFEYNMYLRKTLNQRQITSFTDIYKILYSNLDQEQRNDINEILFTIILSELEHK